MTGPEVTLVVTIDTENDTWAPSREPGTCGNLWRVPELAARFRSLGIRPTWLPTWDVATDPFGRELLLELHRSGDGEVGAHLHPWSTPPFDEPFTPAATMLSNLPEPLQREKIRRLTAALEDVLGARPRSFRAGRWGLGATTARAVAAEGYEVDSSVTPFIDWSTYEGPSFAQAPQDAYRIGGTSPVTAPDPEGPLLEVPLTTGFNRLPFDRANRLRSRLSRPSVRFLRLRGLAHRTSLLRRLVLAPEETTARDLVVLARHHVALGRSWLNLMFHTQSLVPGLSPFVRTDREAERLVARIEKLVEKLAAETRLRFATLSELAASLAPTLRASSE